MIRTAVAAVVAALSLATMPLLACAPCLTPIKKQVVAAVPVITPAAVVVASYGASYQPPNNELELIREQLKQLKQQMERMELLLKSATVDDKEPAGTTIDGKALVAATCAKCHTPKLAPSKGKKVVVVEEDGRASLLSVIEQNATTKAITSGSMPPGGRWSDAQKKAALDYLFSRSISKE